MQEKIEDLFEELENKLIKEYGNVEFITMEEIPNVSVTRFSNVTLGKEDVQYQLVNTKDITEESIVRTSFTSQTLKHQGSKKGVEKYRLKKGDVIFPQKRRFKTIGVMISNTNVPYVGHHGLMKISCGNNLDLAFFIKDYLQLDPIKEFIALSMDNGGNLLTVIKMLPLPRWALTTLAGYSPISLKLEEVVKELNILQNNMSVLREKNHMYSEQRNKHEKAVSSILNTLKTLNRKIKDLS